jgi:hypothetical protein
MGATTFSIDVVDDAGGDYIADTKVFRGIRPENDGTIHIDYRRRNLRNESCRDPSRSFRSVVAYQNCCWPRTPTKIRRECLAPRPLCNRWPPRTECKVGQERATGLYASHRVGNFRYILPVVPLEKYRVRLYFQEPWFGKENVTASAAPAAGSSTFGVTALFCSRISTSSAKAAQGQSRRLLTMFRRLRMGKIELIFSPIINYPLINAIEVLPEPSK